MGSAVRAADAYGLAARPAFSAFNGGKLPPNTAPIATTWSTEVAFPNLTFFFPLGVLPLPGTNKLVVWEREGRIYSFDNDPATATKTLILDLHRNCQGWDDAGLLAMVFHPNFATNRYAYVYYNWVPTDTVVGNVTTRPDLNSITHQRLSRFTFNPTTGVFDPASEYVIIDQIDHCIWHNGGGLFFNPGDGFLYLTNGNDANDANDQKINGGMFGVLIRIDVDKRGGAISHLPTKRAFEEVGLNWPNAYYVPNSNPFVGVANAVEEIFALGLRSPHRATVDPVTGRIFIGDVGEGRFEEVDLIEPSYTGAQNFQWHAMEGFSGEFNPPYPGVSRPPVLAYPHGTDGNAVIGGYVYRGTKFSELVGKYIFGDNVTNRIWYLDESTSPPGKVLLATLPKGTGANSGFDYRGLGSFGYNADGELYLCQLGSNGSKIFRLSRAATVATTMPPKLSDTGIFSSLATLTPVQGFLAYDVNTPLWSDGAHKQRWFAVPSGQTIGYAATGEWTFPQGSVFVKHFDLPINDANPNQLKRLETRVLVRDDKGYVYGGSYKWRADGTDADLVAESLTENVTITGTNQTTRVQPWFYPGTQDCLVCHNGATGGVLGLNTPQNHRAHAFPETGITDNQLRAWNHVGYFAPAIDEATLPTLQKLSALSDTSASLEQRARSYLDANCSHCHRTGGVHAFWDARIETPLENAGIVNGAVGQDLGVAGAKVVVPQDLLKSILYKRASTATADYKMPPIAKNLVDQDAVAVLQQWINSLQTQNPPGTLPPPWQHRDIGTVALAGDASAAGGTFTLYSSGFDIWDTADEFHYVYQDMTGDGRITARVVSVDLTDVWAKAGVMIRETLGAGSAYALSGVTPDRREVFQSRVQTDGGTTSGNLRGAAPYWVRLERTGDVLIGSRSADGVTWEEVGRKTVVMAAAVKVGLFLTGHNESVLGGAVIDNVSIEQLATFAVTSTPANAIAAAGEPFAFQVGYTGTPMADFQWKKGADVLVGETKATLSFASPTLQDTGEYNLFMGDAAVATARLVVVGRTPYQSIVTGGATAAVGVETIADSGASFQWAKDGVPLIDGVKYAGATTGKLTVKKFAASDEGTYACTVTGNGVSRVFDGYVLRLLGKPQVTAPAPPEAIVSGSFAWKLSASEPFTTFTVTGLPSGLVYQAATGSVVGTPNVSGDFPITILARNSLGTTSKTFKLHIERLPQGLAGGYSGLIERDATLNGDLAGLVTVTVSSTGQVTGRLLRGAVPAVALKGRLAMNMDRTGLLKITLPQGKDLPLLLTLNFEPAEFSAHGTLDRNGATSSVDLRHHASVSSATMFAGNYNARLDLPAASVGDAAVPQGTGWIRSAVRTTGSVSISGRLPDGQVIMSTTALRNDLRVPFYTALYNGRGSYLGTPRFQFIPDGVGMQLSGITEWRKLAPASPNDRSYAALSLNLDLTGQNYSPPASGTVILGLPNTAANARISFTAAGIGAAAQNSSLAQTFRLLPSGVGTFGNSTVNPCTVKLAVDPLTGIISGGFQLKDGKLLRSVGFSGLVVPRATSAFGYFLLPQLADPNAVPPTTPLTSQILSGRFELAPAP